MSLAPNETQQPMSREAYQRWYDAQPSGRFERVEAMSSGWRLNVPRMSG